MGKKLFSSLGVLVVLAFSLVLMAQPASAATKTVTITVGDWNCRINGQYSGTVVRALIDVVPGNNPSASWVNGRSRTVNVIYQPGGSRVTIGAEIFCKTSWWGGGYYRTISAGRWVDSSTGTAWSV